jgi:predicted nucleotidyltransferase
MAFEAAEEKAYLSWSRVTNRLERAFGEHPEILLEVYRSISAISESHEEFRAAGMPANEASRTNQYLLAAPAAPGPGSSPLQAPGCYSGRVTETTPAQAATPFESRAGLAEALAGWCREEDVRLCVLFGSRSTGKAHPRSDLDLAVWPPLSPRQSRARGARREAPAPRERLRWMREVQRLVDRTLAERPELNLVIVTGRLDPVLGREIARDGTVLFEAEENLWNWERLRLFQLFNDARPFLRAQREEIRRYAEEIRRDGA